MHKLITIGAGLALALATFMPAASATPLPKVFAAGPAYSFTRYCFMGGGKRQCVAAGPISIRPHRILVAADGNDSFSNLVWHRWAPNDAVATGVQYERTSTSAGNEVPVRIELSDPVRTRRGPVFVLLAVTSQGTDIAGVDGAYHPEFCLPPASPCAQ